MEEKNVVIWANCQGGPIGYMLRKNFRNIFYFQNYIFIKENIELPNKIKEADIFIYQNYADKPDSIYDLNNILSTLKESCVVISIPFLQCDLYFPYCNSQHIKNKNSISPKFPHGKFFFGIEPIHKLCENNDLSTEDIINLSKEINFISTDKIEYYYDRYLDFMDKKILNSDVPELYNFILNNYRTTRLFYNRNHPSYELTVELLKSIFNKLNIEYIETESDKIFLEKSLKDWISPIFPSIVEHYNLEFDTNYCFSLFDENITDIDSYLSSLINEIRN